MPRDSSALIAELVEDLAPVRQLRLGEGLALALGAAAVSAVAVALLAGLREDLLTGRLDPMLLLANALYLGLGIAASLAVIVMSRPQVGSDHGGWRWAAGMAALLPIAGAIVALGRGPSAALAHAFADGAACVGAGVLVSLLVFAALTAWLRRGAPTSPERAGLVTGIAAGACGIAAFSLHCADNDIVHLGLGHGAVVLVMAGAGRLLVPQLVRW